MLAFPCVHVKEIHSRELQARPNQVLGSEEAFNSHLRNNAEGGCCQSVQYQFAVEIVVTILCNEI